MKIRTLIIGALLILLTGCGPKTYTHHDPHMLNNFDREFYDCKVKARQIQGGELDIAAALSIRPYVEECMEAKGYTEVD